jgi:hypothetical protein
MAHADHDSIIRAFGLVDPRCSICAEVGGPTGYTHIHGPNQPRGAERCTTHSVIVETCNGTVGLRRELAKHVLHLRDRAQKPISVDPLGYAAGPEYGQFEQGILASEIIRHWGSYDEFAHHVIKTIGNVLPPW